MKRLKEDEVKHIKKLSTKNAETNKETSTKTPKSKGCIPLGLGR